MESVSLTISKDIVNPIVETKIKEAIIEALGGQDEIVKRVIEEIMTRKVNSDGSVSMYSSDNKYNWLDVIVTKKIKEAVEMELKDIIAKSANSFKDELIRQLQTKRGASQVAQALLDGFASSLSYRANFSVNFIKD